MRILKLPAKILYYVSDEFNRIFKNVFLCVSMQIAQGRRRFLKSGTAIERRRRSARAEGSSGRRAREGSYPLS